MPKPSGFTKRGANDVDWLGTCSISIGSFEFESHVSMGIRGGVAMAAFARTESESVIVTQSCHE
jgi:hypothetical protein